MFVLSNEKYFVRLSERPGLTELRDRNGSRLAANPAGLPSIWGIYEPATGEWKEIADNDPGVQCRLEKTENAAVWRMELPVKSGWIKAALEAELCGDCLCISLKEVEETPEAHLVTVRLNGLAAAVENDPLSRLALPSHGGRLIDPAVCADGQTDHRYNWILDSFGSAAVVYTKRLTAVLRVRQMDDQLTSLVGGSQGERYAQMGALLRRRYTRLDVSYRRAKPDRDPANQEDVDVLPVETDFLLNTSPCVNIEMVSHDVVRPESGWTLGAARVRDSLPGKPSDVYRDKMVYKIFVGAPGQPTATNLEQIRKLIFQLAARTDNGGQLPYLVGFQHRGHDDNYPDVFTLNPALESMEKLAELAQDARKVNCLLSFHDNYDDAYACSPSWNGDDISRDHTGHLLRGGVWNGVQAYWNSMPYYAAHRSEERIRRTLSLYPFLRDSYHLDVLTASVFRIDFRAGEPSGKEADLQARLRIVGQFRKRGLDVSSEACGLPFVGGISYFWHMQRVPRSLYEGDRRIPMAPFLAHGKADYGGTHTDCLHNILDGLLYGGFYCNDVTAATPIKELTDAYFMLQVPLNRLRDETACEYEEKNGWKIVRYASGAEIAIQFEEEACRVTIDGKRWIENGTAMLPGADESVVFYRCQEEPYEDVRWQSSCPAGTRFEASPVGTDDPILVLTASEDGSVPVDTPLGVAYRVRRLKA